MSSLFIGVTVLLATALVASLLVDRYVAYATKQRILDLPNKRSSHSIPTPRGGGIVIHGLTAAALLVVLLGDGFEGYVGTLLVGFVAVGMVSWLDDRVSVRARYRLLIQLASALLVAAVGAILVPKGPWWIALPIGTVSACWAANLFNFMDGIDGLAGSEATFIALALACYFFLAGETAWAALSTVLAGSSLGFLKHNWPPARVFMGDVGSASIGFLLAGVGLLSPIPPALVLILSGVFIADATSTLAVRIVTGQKWWTAHRSHAYQNLSRWLRSHRNVSVLSISANVVWVLPGALLCLRYPEFDWLIAALVIGPLSCVCLLLRCGQPNASPPRWLPLSPVHHV